MTNKEPREIELLVVHCAATPPGMDIGVKEIDKWHRDRGFVGIGYHYVIRRDGEIEKGRDEEVAGAHVKGFNAKSIGICLVGGMDETMTRAENNFTEAQFHSLTLLLSSLRLKHEHAYVVGHNQLDKGKECPSFNVIDWLKPWYNALDY